MSRKYKAEEIVAKLRQVEVLSSQGQSVAEAESTADITELALRYGRKMNRSLA